MLSGLIVLQEVERKDSLLSEADEVRRSISEELRKTREQLKAERDKWDQERDGFKQVRGWVSFCMHVYTMSCMNNKSVQTVDSCFSLIRLHGCSVALGGPATSTVHLHVRHQKGLK